MTVQKIIFLVTLFFVTAANAQQPLYKNKALLPEARAKDLVGRMTVDEKLMQLQCIWQAKSTFIDGAGNFDEAKAAPLLKNGLGEFARLNEEAGPNSLGFHPRQAAELYNKVQHFFVEKTRLGIPVMVHEESLHGQQTRDATVFPVPMGLASSWNEGLMSEIYTNVAEEVRARGGQQVLAPVVDVVRDPRWGRTEETMGEDPYLISRLAMAQVRAYQGDGVYLGKNNVAATLKHFGVHGQSEGGNNVAPSNIDERTAREIFFKPFKACVQFAGAMNVMATYNELWGLPAHINKYLLTDILRKEWGFKGIVVSDYYAIPDVSTLHKVTPSVAEAGYLAFKAGVDIETPDSKGFENLKQYVVSGKITTRELDDAVTKVLVAKFRLGLFENPYVDATKAEEIVGSKAKRAVAYKAATEAMVLLKNDNNFLPLDKTKIKTIAFIGPNADKCLLGGYASIPRTCVSPLQALKEKYGSQINVLYAEGVRITDKNNWFADTINLVPRRENDARIKEAVEIAKQADVVVLFVGSNESTNREGWAANHLGDLPTLELLNGQNELVNEIVAVGKPTCAFVNSGPPLSIGNLVNAVPAVMQCWYLGQEGGYAMVDALFGDVNPSGKLPISFPRDVGHIPAYYNYKPSARRGYNLGFEVSPLFAFGHGLSYTTFSCSAPKLSSSTMKKNGTVTVSVDVKNTGNRRGAEVVQLYIRDEYASVPRPVKELKGFEKVWLEPGQSKKVTFGIFPEALSFYDKDMKWIVEPGDFTIMVGTSSDKTQDVKLKVTE
ncbi:glycoside hydrolase family 3 N-terminal domain-containing protein [Flavisolibacter ginsenosidimutans]|uniref:Beta-glucosidase n=1 Tax=Flavisolibacter ginsenosidimutans TaxID=661481 RepID=A0A5B8UIT6_9BACT|nr:glycoside hydrolase family 3 N-terminal domain-containing protein [Flavisolibacter ginsenosidimutans]QEC56332.1 beta-glucosidase [Flavisolibacter ginsenosidimutans]